MLLFNRVNFERETHQPRAAPVSLYPMILYSYIHIQSLAQCLYKLSIHNIYTPNMWIYMEETRALRYVASNSGNKFTFVMSLSRTTKKKHSTNVRLRFTLTTREYV